MDHPFERLLLATEHTEFDTGAERVAMELARRCERPLMAVLPLVTNPEYEAVAPELADRADREAAARLADLRVAAGAAGVELAARVRRGEEAWYEIVAEAADVAADLLVIRRRGKAGFLARLLVGEMVARIAGHAACSVLTVPRAASMWQHRVLAAVDGSPVAGEVLRVAAAVAERCALPLDVLHILPEGSPPERHRTASEALAGAAAPFSALEIDLRVGEGRPFDGILQHAAARGADLIVIGARGESEIDRPVLGGTAQKVIGLADGPVLVVRGSPATDGINC